jgi:hypothetical protein
MLGGIFNKGTRKKNGPSDREVEDFCEAAGGAYLRLEKLLEKYGGDTLVARTRGRALISRAARAGDLYVMEPLLKNGFDINEKDTSGKSALAEVARYNHQVSEELLKRGRSLDTWGVINWLLKNGAHIDAVDRTGRTPLMHAAETLNKRTIELLLENGANINAVDKDGKTALMIARGRACNLMDEQIRQKEIIDCLEHYAEVQAEAEEQRKKEQHEQWLEDTDFSKGTGKPIPASRPLGPKA